MNLPIWSDKWAIFATSADVPFAAAGLLGCLLIILWWRQQSANWLRVALGTLLLAVLLAIASYYFFAVPPWYAGCPEGCAGWRGYPLRMALTEVSGRSILAPGDFALNVMILWLLWLAASVFWRLLATLFQFEDLSRRWRIIFVVVFVVLPWALLPRILNPPQPTVLGEELRLANNARRAAEFTYGVTGLWVQRLALEDVRRGVDVESLGEALEGAEGSGTITASPASGRTVNQVCMRGYTWFYLPWQRYVVALDANGANALGLWARPLDESCWS